MKVITWALVDAALLICTIWLSYAALWCCFGEG